MHKIKNGKCLVLTRRAAAASASIRSSSPGSLGPFSLGGGDGPTQPEIKLGRNFGRKAGAADGLDSR